MRTANRALCATLATQRAGAPLASAVARRLASRADDDTSLAVDYVQRLRMWVSETRRAALGGIREVELSLSHAGGSGFRILAEAYKQRDPLPLKPCQRSALCCGTTGRRTSATTPTRSGARKTLEAFGELVATLLMLFGDRVLLATGGGAPPIGADLLRRLLGPDGRDCGARRQIAVRNHERPPRCEPHPTARTG
jgi:hypothetical protein